YIYLLTHSSIYFSLFSLSLLPENGKQCHAASFSPKTAYTHIHFYGFIYFSIYSFIYFSLFLLLSSSLKQKVQELCQIFIHLPIHIYLFILSYSFFSLLFPKRKN